MDCVFEIVFGFCTLLVAVGLAVGKLILWSLGVL